MISLRCMNPLCARAWLETPGFQKVLPKRMRGRCAYCGHGKVAIYVHHSLDGREADEA